MQAHQVQHLSTIKKPYILRDFLGNSLSASAYSTAEEIKGDLSGIECAPNIHYVLY